MRIEEQIIAMHNEITAIFDRYETFFGPHSPQANLARSELTTFTEKLKHLKSPDAKIGALNRHMARLCVTMLGNPALQPN